MKPELDKIGFDELLEAVVADGIEICGGGLQSALQFVALALVVGCLSQTGDDIHVEKVYVLSYEHLRVMHFAHHVPVHILFKNVADFEHVLGFFQIL